MHGKQSHQREPNKAKDMGEDASDEYEQVSKYRPSTSLEQIADWLTKIIVGVGLTQLSYIPGKLDALSVYIASGMGDAKANKPFVLAVVVYFFVSGFPFGFLWSRLYMLRAFAEAEILKAIAKISQFDFDNEAINLVSRQFLPRTVGRSGGRSCSASITLRGVGHANHQGANDLLIHGRRAEIYGLSSYFP
jgi:hypothetical protein